MIAALMAHITAKALGCGIFEASCLILPMLFVVIGVEEFAERAMRCVHIRILVKKLRNRKVLPPAS